MKKEQRDYLKNWLFRANEDIAVINNLFNSYPSFYASSICYHAQQAVEKFLKAFLVFHSVDFKKTYDVDFLHAECKAIYPNGNNIELRSIAKFSINMRYPDKFYVLTKKNHHLSTSPTRNKIRSAISVKDLLTRTIWVSCSLHFLLLLLHPRQIRKGSCTRTRASARN